MDWEAILVDDCSTDCSLKIAMEFTDTDKRFRVLRQEKKQGQSAARNRGISEAKGEYITFLDSDDWLDTDFLEIMLHHSGPFDMIRCGFKRMSDAEILYKRKPLHKWQFSIVCSCLFKSASVRNLSFQEGHCYEDILWTTDFLLKHPKIKIIRYYGYNYRLNPSSTTSRLHKADAANCIRLLIGKGFHPVVIYWTVKQSIGFALQLKKHDRVGYVASLLRLRFISKHS